MLSCRRLRKEGIGNKKQNKLQKYSNVEWSAKAEKEAKGMTGLADVYFERGVSQGLERGLEQGLQRGLEQGLEQGLQQGRLSERISMLLRFNVPEDDIINEITKEFGLKDEEVKELIKTNHENG